MAADVPNASRIVRVMHHHLACAISGVGLLLLAGCDDTVTTQDVIDRSCADMRKLGIIDDAAEQSCKSSREGYMAAAEAEAAIYGPEAFGIYEGVRAELDALYANLNVSAYRKTQDALSIPDLWVEEDEAVGDQRVRISLSFSISDINEGQTASIVATEPETSEFVSFATGNLPQRFIDDLAWPCAVVECRGEFFLDKLPDPYGGYEMGIVALRLAPMTVDDFHASLIESAERLVDRAYASGDS